MSRTKALLSSRTSVMEKLRAFVAAGIYYAAWYPKQWLPSLPLKTIGSLPASLTGHMHYVQSTSRKLARHMFHQMIRHQKRLEAKQSILNRIVDIGSDLFAMATVCSYAASLAKEDRRNAVELADLFCHQAKTRIEDNFRESGSNSDHKCIAVSKMLMAQEFGWLETDIIK